MIFQSSGSSVYYMQKPSQPLSKTEKKSVNTIGVGYIYIYDLNIRFIIVTLVLHTIVWRFAEKEKEGTSFLFLFFFCFNSYHLVISKTMKERKN